MGQPYVQVDDWTKDANRVPDRMGVVRIPADAEPRGSASAPLGRTPDSLGSRSSLSSSSSTFLDAYKLHCHRLEPILWDDIHVGVHGLLACTESLQLQQLKLWWVGISTVIALRAQAVSSTFPLNLTQTHEEPKEPTLSDLQVRHALR